MTSWKQDVGDQAPFTANDDVVVFTSETMTTGLDLRSGRKVWSYPDRATAGSGGQSSYDPRRWVPRSEWIAVDGPKSKRLPAAVLDAGTGQVAAVVQAKSADFVIAGQTFIEFGYEKGGRRVAQGTPLAGGRTWSAEFARPDFRELFDVVDGKARALYSNRAVFITPEDGALQQVPIQDDWSVAWFVGPNRRTLRRRRATRSRPQSRRAERRRHAQRRRPEPVGKRTRGAPRSGPDLSSQGNPAHQPRRRRGRQQQTATR